MKTDNEQYSEPTFHNYQLLLSSEEWKLIRAFTGEPMPPTYDGESKVLMDWNDLIPLVEKIESMGPISVEIIGQYCRINKQDSPHFQCEKIESSKLQSVCWAVIEFIKFYNSLESK